MDSADLYQVKQQFTLGAYQSVAEIKIPDVSSSDYNAFLLYKSRALIATGRAKEVDILIPQETGVLSLKAVRSLAHYFLAAASGDEGETPLEELRDLCVEVEEDVPASERWSVRILAGTAFVQAGELEEALETLGVGTNSESLEAVALVVQIFLSISRADLAKKEHTRALKWAEDDLLLQSIEATLGLGTGADAYRDATAFYTEQLGNPSLASSHLLVSRGIARLLRGEINAARSDLEEVLGGQTGLEEALAANVVSSGLGITKKGETDELFSELSSKYPSNPLVNDLQEKSSLFDDLAKKFEAPSSIAIST